jgi:DNA-binding NarL/FixJ family response regulator
MKRKISILLVDDHSLVRSGFRHILEDEPDMEVIGEAADGDEAVELAKQLKPDVIVMDSAMPRMTGLVATRQILDIFPEAAILILSMHSEDTLVRQALEAGAKGYLLKNAVDLGLQTAIRRVAAGDVVLDPQIAQSASRTGEGGASLTRRELEILEHIVAGESNKEIAGALGLSANTVAVHRANIMEALGVRNTAELVVYAIRNGLVILP